MRHTLPLPGRCLAAVLFTAIGLGAYGCGDSATVSEPATLGNLSASTGELQPPFAPETTDYTVRLSSDVSSTTITASPRVAGDSIQIDNQPITSRTVTLASPGDEKSITIIVTDTGAGGASKSYRVTVKRDKEDTSLLALSVSEGTLAPPQFDKNIRDYTVNNVGPSVTKVIISATKSNQNTVMQIDWPSGSVTVPAGTLTGQATVQLGGTGSDTKVSIVVTATGGSPNTYTVTINRGPSNDNFLKSLSIQPGKLDFKVTSFVYNVNVLSNVDKVTVTATPRDPTASIAILVNGAVINSQPILLLGPDSTTKITVRVTAQNGTPKNYDINVTRAALNGNNNLSTLSVTVGGVAQSLDLKANPPNYTVKVASTVTSVTVNATKAATSQIAIEVNGVPTNTQPIPLLDPGSTTIIKIRVTAQNGQSKDYFINVVRAALGGDDSLKSLTVSPGTLNPAFSVARTFPYTVNDIGSSATAIRVTATPQDPTASVTINGPSVTINGQGEKSLSIPLPGGPSSTEIDVLVRAPNGNDRTYLITVTQPAPAAPSAPTVAPDLIDADDPYICIAPDPFDPNDPNACDPTKSDATTKDNITNVTKPGFSILPPSAGETAKLYIKDINGKEYPSSLDSNNTFRPNNPLPEGDFDITYTLSNSGGESGPSPALKVTIDTGGIAPPPPPPTP